MNGKFLASVTIFFLFTTGAGLSTAQSTESADLVQHVVSSDITGQTYRLFVVTPENYMASSTEAYDVVHILDMSSEDASQLVQFQRTFAQLAPNTEFIFVGIGFSTDEEHRGLRTAHFTPSRNEEIDNEILALFPVLSESANVRNWRSGGAREFAAVLNTEIVPFIEENYSSTGSDTVMGASLAGLFLTTILFEQPDMFENYVITSPSVWWNEFELFDNTSLLHRQDLQGQVYLSVGSLEDADMLESYNRLSGTLEVNSSSNLKYISEVIENQTHLSVVPISFMNGLNYVLSNSVD